MPPRVDEGDYVPFLARAIAEHGVDLVVPLTDLDQLLLAGRRSELGALVLLPDPPAIELTNEGKRFMAESLQIDTDTLAHPRRPVCKACLDWSERRHHLAGTLGAAVMSRFTELKWAARDDAPGSRVVNFTRTGEKRFAALFGNGEA